MPAWRYNMNEKMTDTQILTLALTAVVPSLVVMLGVLINNIRLNDVKELLRAEIKAEGAERHADIAVLRGEMSEMRSLIERHHSELMSKLIEMDNRILRLESQRLIQ